MIYKQKNGRDAGRGDLFLSCVPAVAVSRTGFGARPVSRTVSRSGFGARPVSRTVPRTGSSSIARTGAISVVLSVTVVMVPSLIAVMPVTVSETIFGVLPVFRAAVRGGAVISAV